MTFLTIAQVELHCEMSNYSCTSAPCMLVGEHDKYDVVSHFGFERAYLVSYGI